MRRATTAILALAIAGASAPVLAGPPGGVPPGLAKKGVSAAEWQARKWRKGDRLPEGGYVVIRDYDRYGLPRPRDGYSYYRIDGEVVKAVDATLKIAAAVGAVDALLD